MSTVPNVQQMSIVEKLHLIGLLGDIGAHTGKRYQLLPVACRFETTVDPAETPQEDVVIIRSSGPLLLRL